MLRTLCSFFKNESGNFAITFAVIAMPLIGLAGLGVDYGDAVFRRSALTAASDAAALAVSVASKGDLVSNSAKLKAIGTDSFLANLGWSYSGQVDVALDSKLSQVTVSTIFTKEVYFPFLGTSWNISTVSVANVVPVMPVCILALSTSGTGIAIGGSASFNAPKCGVQSNATLKKWGAASATAGKFCTASSSVSGGFSPLETNCPVVADPFLPIVKFPNPSAPCTNNSGSYGGGPAQITPGVYCNGIALKGNANVTMSPGVYVVRGSNLDIGANARLRGDGVVIIFQGSARFSFGAGSEVTLSAPTSGDWKGMVIAQDGSTAQSGGESVIGGGGTVELNGSIYLPKQTLSISGGGNLNMTSLQTAVVAERFSFTGNADMALTMRMGSDFEAAGFLGSPMGGLVKVRLVK